MVLKRGNEAFDQPRTIRTGATDCCADPVLFCGPRPILASDRVIPQAKEAGAAPAVPVMAKAIGERLSYRAPSTGSHPERRLLAGWYRSIPGQDGAGLQLDLSPVECDELGHDGVGRLYLADPIKELADRRIEVARLICLPPIAYNGWLQMLRKMRQRGPA